MGLVNGVWIDGKHSFNEYGLYFSRRPDKGKPEPKLKLVEVPGIDGELDYTEAIDGTVKYSNRQMSIEFTAFAEVDNQAKIQSKVRGAWHGRNIKLEFDEEPGWIYSGRATVEFVDMQPHKFHVVLTVDAEPFKTAANPTELDFDLSDLHAIKYEIPHQISPVDESKNSYFKFVTAGNPYQDFSFFTTLRASWPVAGLRHARNPTVELWIKDVEENTYHVSASYSTGYASMTLGNATDVDLSKITRITVLNAPNATLTFGHQLCSELKIYNSGPVIIPEFSKKSDLQFHFFCNGYHKFTSVQTSSSSAVRYAGEDLILLPGENQVIACPIPTQSQDFPSSWSWAEIWYYEKRL